MGPHMYTTYKYPNMTSALIQIVSKGEGKPGAPRPGARMPHQRARGAGTEASPEGSVLLPTQRPPGNENCTAGHQEARMRLPPAGFG